MFTTDGLSTAGLTDVTRFVGRAPRVLGARVDAAMPMGICTTSVAQLDELALFTHLSALADALSPTVIWMLTDCSARTATEMAKWCERREVFWHYCATHHCFALARR